MKKQPVLMTGVYRSGTEFALQLISGTKEISTSMYSVNAFRYLPDDNFFGNNLLKAINKISINLNDNNKILLKENLVISILKKDFPSLSTYSRSQIYHAIVSSLYLNDKNIDTWIEKTQLNWTKTSEFLEQLPNSKAILIYRDPRAALASFKKFTNAPSPAYLGTIFNYLSFFQTLTALKNSKYKDRVFSYSYEQIINDPQKYRYCLQDFLGKPKSSINNLDWQYSDGKKWKSNTTQDEATIINNPKSLIDSWKEKLNPEEIIFSEIVLNPYIELYGYKSMGLEGNIIPLLNSLFNHPSTNYMYRNYLKTGGGIEFFPTNPNT